MNYSNWLLVRSTFSKKTFFLLLKESSKKYFQTKKKFLDAIKRNNFKLKNTSKDSLGSTNKKGFLLYTQCAKDGGPQKSPSCFFNIRALIFF